MWSEPEEADYSAWYWPGIGDDVYGLFKPFSSEERFWIEHRLPDGYLWRMIKAVSWHVEDDHILSDMGYRANQWDEALRETYMRWAIINVDEFMTDDEIERTRREKRRAEDAMWAYLKGDYDMTLAWRQRFTEGPLHQLLTSPPNLRTKKTFVSNPNAW